MTKGRMLCARSVEDGQIFILEQADYQILISGSQMYTLRQVFSSVDAVRFESVISNKLEDWNSRQP